MWHFSGALLLRTLLLGHLFAGTASQDFFVWQFFVGWESSWVHSGHLVWGSPGVSRHPKPPEGLCRNTELSPSWPEANAIKKLPSECEARPGPRGSGCVLASSIPQVCLRCAGHCVGGALAALAMFLSLQPTPLGCIGKLARGQEGRYFRSSSPQS